MAVTMSTRLATLVVDVSSFLGERADEGVVHNDRWGSRTTWPAPSSPGRGLFLRLWPWGLVA